MTRLDDCGTAGGSVVPLAPSTFHARGEMPSPSDAAEKIREKLVAGTLPDGGGIAFVGLGAGQDLCDSCGTPIRLAKLELAMAPRRGIGQRLTSRLRSSNAARS